MSQTFKPLAEEDILEAYFTNMQRSQTVYVVMLNTDGTIIMVNRGLARLFGKLPDELVGTSWFDVMIPKGDQSTMQEQFKRILATGLPDVYENPIVLPDGTSRSVLWSNSLTHNGDLLTGTLSLGIDVTERKEKERQLTVSELSYRRLFEAAQDGILILNAETGIILDANQYLIDLLGYSKEDFLNKYLWDVGLFKDIAASKENFETLRQKGFIRFEDLPLESKSGKKVEVEFVANSYQVDHTTIMQCNIRNITDRVIAQDALALTARQLLNAEQAAGLGTYVLDVRAGKWTSSVMMDRIFGIGPDNPRTVESWANLVHPGDRADMIAYFQNEVLGKKQPFDRVYRTVRAIDGETRWVHGYGKLELDATGAVITMSGAIRDITDAHNEQEALRQAEQKYHTIFDRAPVGVARVGLDKKFLDTNEAFQRFLGYTGDELALKTIADITYPEDAAIGVDEMGRIIMGSLDSATVEKRYVRKDGAVVWGRTVINLVRNADGSPAYFLPLVRDITEEKQQRTTSLQSLALLQAVADGTDQPIFVKDLEGRILLANHALAAMLGKQPSDVIGVKGSELFPSSEADAFVAVDRKVLTTGETITYEESITSADGNQRQYVTAKGPVRDARGAISGLFGISRDVTAERSVQRQLAHTAEQALTINKTLSVSMQTLGVGYWVRDHKTNMLEISDTGYAILGRPPRPLLPLKEFLEFFSAETQQVIANVVKEFSAKGKSADFIVPMTTPAGEDRWLRLVTSIEKDDTGSPSKTYGVLQDVSEQKRSQDALEASEKKFRMLVEGTSDIPFSLDIEGTFDFMGPQADRYGLKTKFVGTHFTEFIHPDDRERILNTFKRTLETGKETLSEFRIIDGTGNIHWLEEVAAFRRDASGKPIGFTGVLRDITERVKSQQLIQSQKETLESLLAGMDEGFAEHEVILDKQGKAIDYRFLAMNKSYERLTGLKASDLIGKTCREALPGTEQIWIDRFGEVATTGKSATFTSFSKEAGQKSYRVSAWCTKPNHFAVIFSDVTESQNLLSGVSAILDNTLDMIAIITPTGTCTYQNGTSLKVLGYTPDEMIGKNILSWVNPVDLPAVTAQLSKGMMTPNAAMPATFRFKHKDGSWRWLESIGVNLLHDKRVNGILITSRDITDVKRGQEVSGRMDELEAMNKAMVGRELRISELKAEVARLTDALAKERLKS